MAVLGMGFLRGHQLLFDQENMRIGIAKAKLGDANLLEDTITAETQEANQNLDAAGSASYAEDAVTVSTTTTLSSPNGSGSTWYWIIGGFIIAAFIGISFVTYRHMKKGDHERRESILKQGPQAFEAPTEFNIVTDINPQLQGFITADDHGHTEAGISVGGGSH